VPSCLVTYLASMLIFFLVMSVASKDIFSRRRSITVWSLLAPMFSVRSLTCQAMSAIFLMPFWVKFMSTFSVFIRALYCSVSDAVGSVKILMKSFVVSALSSTLIGRRPCSSGMRSEGLDRWKAPEAMNRMWSVRIMPYLVLTEQPSIRGSRSLWTPSLDTLPDVLSVSLTTLSISSMKTMPFCSTFSTAVSFILSWLMSFSDSSVMRILCASFTVIFRVFCWSPPMFWKRLCSWEVISSMPGGATISTPIWLIVRSISISLSSSSPSRSFLRKNCRALVVFSRDSSEFSFRGVGTRTSSTLSSADSSALAWTFSYSCSLVSLMETSTRSRMIESTSRPT